MALKEELLEHKGTTAFSKQMAKQVLQGNKAILNNCLDLIHDEEKWVRIGAAKIIEKVAEENPNLVAEHLAGFMVCMNYPETQTRWMVLYIAGLCAALQPVRARELLDEAVKYFSDKKYGTVLNDRAITYFGYLGAVSQEDFNTIYPYMIECFSLHQNRITRLLEGLYRQVQFMGIQEKEELNPLINKYLESGSSAEKKWAKKLEKKLNLV